MLNAEKFKKEILENLGTDCLISFNKRNHKIEACTANQCLKCLFNAMRGNKSCYNAMLKWLLSEYKEPVKLSKLEKEPVKLSKLEYDILKYLSDNTVHMYITRDGNGNIFLYDVEPEKSNSAPWWTGRGMCHMNMFNKLFQFVQFEDEEPRAIKDILESCEVVEDDL